MTRLIGEVAARHGVTIAIEPLNRKETNPITPGEGGAQAAVNLPNVGLLAERLPSAQECEPPRIGEIAPLMHTHIALLRRRYPTEASDGR